MLLFLITPLLQLWNTISCGPPATVAEALHADFAMLRLWPIAWGVSINPCFRFSYNTMKECVGFANINWISQVMYSSSPHIIKAIGACLLQLQSLRGLVWTEGYRDTLTQIAAWGYGYPGINLRWPKLLWYTRTLWQGSWWYVYPRIISGWS